MTQRSQKKENYSKELMWEGLQESLKEDSYLTEEQLQEKYRGLNLAMD